jgi:hypothetical protein
VLGYSLGYTLSLLKELKMYEDLTRLTPGEYLSKHNDTAGLKKILEMFKDWPDKFFWVRPEYPHGNLLPLYKIIKIENDQLVLQCTELTKIDSAWDFENGERWETFNVSLTDKTVKVNFVIMEEDPNKIGVNFNGKEQVYFAAGSIRDTDISKPIKVRAI